ncbi:phage tail sheath family protein [Paenibacillus sp. FSL W8-1187]|uniref:phage tail sheath family protein n=1 Tax=Paenibacillus sp. FSL W8-1187 TaxID=2975339 RepID=UPI0030DC1670
MAGGMFTAMNKVRPGVYINFATEGTAVTTGDRGTLALPLPLSWGEPRRITVLEGGENPLEKLGYALSAPELLLVREAMKRAGKLLVYRINGGTAAKATLGGVTAEARYPGVRGNDLRVSVEASVDKPGQMEVATFVGGSEVDRQIVLNAQGLKANTWIVWTGSGALEATAGVPLAGGTDGAATNEDYAGFLQAIELQDFHVAVYPGTDVTMKSLFAAFAARLREEEGRKIQVVLENYASANHEGVISVRNGVTLEDGKTLTPGQAAVWVAAATAAAGPAASLTYAVYEGASDASPRLTNSATAAALLGGEFVFTARSGSVVVEQDINSYHSPTPQKGRIFAKNSALRVLDGIATDFKATFESLYIGKVGNDANGRALFRKDCVKLLEQYQELGALQNFDASKDVTVEQGAEADAVVVSVSVQPVDAIEKIYMKVQVS